MAENKHLKRFLVSFLVLALGMISLLVIDNNSVRVDAQNTTPNAYDISQWQGNVSNSQASQLKNEVNFVVLKAENGGLTTDPSFNNNAQTLQNNQVPYGVYDYSLYANQDQARAEADDLYDRAPQAKFYVNDAEQNNAGGNFNASTQAWANEMRQNTRKPVVLYSGLYFMNHNISSATRNDYNALWLADYGVEPNPNYHYDLWQYTDSHYSQALNQKVDASVFPNGNNKPLSFWTGQGRSNHSNVNTNTNVTPSNQNTGSNNDLVIIDPKSNPSNNTNSSNHSNVKPRRQPKNSSDNVKPQPKRRRIVYNPQYYTSGHYLKVVARRGINLYRANGRLIGRVQRGTILTVNHFKTLHYRHLGYITKAVGTHWGAPDLFTSNREYVNIYHY